MSTEEMLDVELLTEQLKDAKANRRFYEMEVAKFDRLLTEALRV